MKTLYVECNMGAAGDMLMAALVNLCANPQKIIEKMNNLGLEGVEVRAVKREKCGIIGDGIDVIVNGILEGEEHAGEAHNSAHGEHAHHHHHHHHEHGHHHGRDHSHAANEILSPLQDSVEHGGSHNHSSLSEISQIIDSLNVSESVKKKAVEVYSVLAEAEAFVHGKEVSHIHFHEVGTLDAVCDIVGCCLALDEISPEKIIVSPVCLGNGSVRCRHGILPVPAPATAYILKGVPVYGGETKGELCTPTGAAILKTFAHSFGSMPQISVEKTSCGMGKKDFERMNGLRMFLGECEEKNEDAVYEISCNLDDITAEELAFSYESLFDVGAVDVFVTPTVMKKGRLGHLLTALAKEKEKNAVAKAVLRHTTTRGVRISQKNRMTLESKTEKVQTRYGEIDMKISSGHGILRVKPEYESVALAAKTQGVTFGEVQKEATLNFRENKKSGEEK